MLNTASFCEVFFFFLSSKASVSFYSCNVMNTTVIFVSFFILFYFFSLTGNLKKKKKQIHASLEVSYSFASDMLRAAVADRDEQRSVTDINLGDFKHCYFHSISFKAA